MDAVTQAALGALTGELLLGRVMGNRALLAGAAVGLLPETDVLLVPFLDNTAWLEWRHSVTDSLWFLVVVAACIGRWWPLGKAPGKPRGKAGPKISKVRVGAAVAVVLAVHILADMLEWRGPKPLAPLFWEPFGCGVLAGFEPLFTVPLLVGIWMTWKSRRGAAVATGRKKVPVPGVSRGALWGMSISAAVVLLAAGAKWLADAGFRKDLLRRGVSADALTEAPTACGFLLWRGVARHGDEIWVGYRSVLDGSDKPGPWTVMPRGGAVGGMFRDMREMRAVDRHSKGFWIARQNAAGAWIADWSEPETREWKPDGQVDLRPGMAWSLVPLAQRDKLIPRPPEGGGGPLKTGWRAMQRVVGVPGTWDGPARLLGVRGSLPQALRTIP